MKSLNSLIQSLNELDEVQKYKRLEKLVDENIEYKEILKKLFYYQKQIVNSKHLELDNNYYIYLEKYNKLKKSLEDDVLISMYFESLEEVNSILEIVTDTITNVINDKL